MRKALRSHSEVAHYWANTVQSEGYASRMSFCDGKLWSYSTVIGEHAKNLQGEDVVVINTTSYSSSTGKHQRHMWDAVEGQNIIHITQWVKRGCSSLLPQHWNKLHWPEGMLESYESSINNLLKRASTARTKKADYLASVAHLREELRIYADTFGLEYEAPANLDEMLEKAKVARQVELAREARLREERVAEQAERLEKWRNLEPVYGYFETTALRLSADRTEVETSRGARVPTEECIQLFPILAKVKNGARINGIKLGHYTITSFDGKTLTVGCHKIPYSEIELIAEQLELLEVA